MSRRGRPPAGSRAVLADVRGPRAGARPGAADITGSELQLIAGAGQAFPLEVRETSLGAVLEWPARRPDVGVGPPPSAAGGAAGGSAGARDGMLKAGFSAVVAIGSTRDRIAPADEGSNL